jgi:uncharacterized protein (DUF2062 family)
VFRRRHPIPFWQRLRHSLWPERGWRRAANYLLMRIKRLPGTPHSIAAGFACGIFISFTPFLGFHFIASMLLTFLVRGNYVAAAVGNMIGNPWTLPFMWLTSYQLGVLILGPEAGIRTPADVDAWTIAWVTNNFGRLFWPMTVGGIPAGLVAALACYVPTAWGIATFQEARRRRREARRLKSASGRDRKEQSFGRAT